MGSLSLVQWWVVTMFSCTTLNLGSPLPSTINSLDPDDLYLHYSHGLSTKKDDNHRAGRAFAHA